MRRVFLTNTLIAITAITAFSQEKNNLSRKWGAEVNLLWPIYPGNIYKGQVTYETWRKNDLAGGLGRVDRFHHSACSSSNDVPARRHTSPVTIAAIRPAKPRRHRDFWGVSSVR